MKLKNLLNLNHKTKATTAAMITKAATTPPATAPTAVIGIKETGCNEYE